MSKQNFKTDFLFNHPNFFSGAGTVFNIGGNYYDFNYSDNEQEADTKALLNDWGVVAKDIIDAMEMTNKSCLTEQRQDAR